MEILISACLLGIPCRYDGNSRPIPALQALAERHTLHPVCPEVLGGLPTPRPPAERQGDGSVRTCTGSDVTEAYRSGGEAAVLVAAKAGCRLAILKERSPACGSNDIYDGSFTNQLTAGKGVAAEQLEADGVLVLGETEALRRIAAGLL